MRKLIAVLLIGMCMAAGLALAEGASVNVEVDTPFEADLDGDGVNEQCQWVYASNENDDDCLCLEITGGDGGQGRYITLIDEPAALWLSKFDAPALVLTGMSIDDTPLTYVLQYAGEGRIREVLFSADGHLRQPDGCYSVCGWGLIAQMSENHITLEAPANVLGTWTARRSYALNPVGRFTFEDDCWNNVARVDDDAAWDDALTTKDDLNYTDEDGNPGVLPEWSLIMITASDKQTFARFVTLDGISGTLAIEPADPLDDFLYYVDRKKSEFDVFESITYEY